MANTFTITGYNVATGVATIDITYNGTTYSGVNMTGVPKDTATNVVAYVKAYAQAYEAGKAVETNKVKAIDPAVVALLNAPTAF